MIDPDSTGLAGAQIIVRDREIIELYILLKSGERDLSPSLRSVLGRTERLLYDHLSIDEMEKLLEV